MQQQIGKLILAPEKPNSSLEIFVAHNDLVEKSGLGQLFLLVEINSREKGVKEKIKQIMEQAQNDYYSSPVPDAESSLETTCQNLNLNLADIIAKPEIWFKKVNILIGVLKDDFLAMTSIGQFSGYLIRQNKITQILDSTLDEFSPGNFFSQLTTGEIKVNDAVVLSNYALFDFFSLEKIKEVVSKLKAGQVVEQFKNLLKENVKIPHVLALVIKYEADTFQVENSDKQTQKYLKDLYGSQESMQQLENLEQRTGRTLKISWRLNIGKLVKSARSKLKKSRTSKDKTDLKLSVPCTRDKKFKLPKIKKLDLASLGAMISKLGKIKEKITAKKEVVELEPSSAKATAGRQKTPSRGLEQTQEVSLEKPVPTTRDADKPERSFNWVGSVVVILIVIFAGSLVYLHFSKQYKNKITSYENILVEVNNKKNEAQAVLIYQDNEKATGLLNSALSLLDELPTKDEDWQAQVGEQRIEIRKLINKINNIYEVELSEVLDLELVGKVKQVIRKGDFLYALINTDKVYKILPESQEITELYTGLDAQKIINWEDKGFLILDNSNHIYFRYGEENELLNISLDAEHKIADIETYGDRIYYLDKTMGAIYKVSQPTNVNPNITVWAQADKDLLSATRQMTIDGNIWLANGGKIVKLFKGKQEEFILSKLEDKLGVDLRVYTEQDWKYIYVLDKINGRILQIDKTGIVHQQFLNEQFKEADNLNINANESAAWVSIENKIYQIILK
ncbi:hypothetical protein KKC16_00440 [Patescibacteria group bacterium]|nr:hypothetical protein [Patescibacteria group bacterium]MBU4481910.1 hypothetical protein [Patescibacteria group bacterium]